jgi:hypothetical protein
MATKTQKAQAADFWRRVDEIKADPQIRLLESDIALMRAVREKAMERINLDELNATDARELSELSDQISKLVSRAAAIDAAQSLTIPQIRLLQDELQRFIGQLPEELRARCIDVVRRSLILSAPATPTEAEIIDSVPALG